MVVGWVGAGEGWGGWGGEVGWCGGRWCVWWMVGGWCARGIIIFQGVLIKLNFSIKFPHLSKFFYLLRT